MFESHREYPTALAADPQQPQVAVATAIKWVIDQRQEVGGRILVFAPGKSNLDNNDLVATFVKLPTVDVMTWRQQYRISWGGGPVLALWPTREKLAEIADHHGTRALCVVPWAAGEVDAWQAAASPDLLMGATPLQHDPASLLDPVVVEGLKHLTRMVNHSNNLAGSMDKRDAINVLTVLHKASYALPPNAVYAWALGNGWPGRGAERLREMVAKIGRGVKMRSGGESLRPDVLDRWRGSV